MRIIAGETPGYAIYDVYVDGVKLDYCFEADDVLGKAYVNIKNADGSWQTDYTGNLAYDVIRGKVEFRPKSVQENMQNNARGDKEAYKGILGGISSITNVSVMYFDDTDDVEYSFIYTTPDGAAVLVNCTYAADLMTPVQIYDAIMDILRRR